jgi:carnitine 3-dehydrogenase
MNIRKVGIVGTGTIGASWAAFFAGKGLHVKMYDSDPDVCARALKKAADMIGFLTQSGLLAPEDPERRVGLIQAVKSLEEVLEGVQWVQESALETYEVKQQIYHILDAHADPEVILASSSSGLLMTVIQKATVRPGRCLIAHPFNPPHLVPLVELVPGKKTSEKTISQSTSFFEKLGKLPVVLKKEVPGHIANRLAAALWREAIHLVLEDVASVSDVDRAISSGPGIRWALMGPHLTYHLGGGTGGIGHFIDHLGPAFESWWRDMATWVSLPSNAKEVLARGLTKEIQGGKNLEELMEWRDRNLAKLIRQLY